MSLKYSAVVALAIIPTMFLLYLTDTYESLAFLKGFAKALIEILVLAFAILFIVFGLFPLIGNIVFGEEFKKYVWLRPFSLEENNDQQKN